MTATMLRPGEFTYKGQTFDAPVSARMRGLAAAVAGCGADQLAPSAIYSVTRRADYCQPYRAAMLVEAKRFLLLSFDAPAPVVDSLSRRRLRDWPAKARAKVRPGWPNV